MNRSTEQWLIASKTTVHTQYCEILANVSDDKGRQAWCKEEVGSLRRYVGKLERILVQTFDKRCDLGQYTLK